MNDKKTDNVEAAEPLETEPKQVQIEDKAPSSQNVNPDITDNENEPPNDASVTQEPPSVRKGTGFGTVLFMSLLAAMIGAGGGAALAPIIGPHLSWQETFSEKPDLVEANAANAEIKAQLAKLETRADISVELADIEALKTRMAALEDRPIITESGAVIDPLILERLAALEAETSPEPESLIEPIDLSAIEARIAALEERITALSSEASTGELDSELMARLEALETAEVTPDNAATDPAVLERLSDLESREIPVLPEPVDLSPMQERLGSLEANLSALKSDFEKAVTARDAIPLPPFPRDEIIAAISTDTEDKGWLGRVVNKHVRVRDTSLIQIVDEIEALVLQGDAKAALARIEDLPLEGRDAAKTWVEAVRIQRTSL